MNTRITKSRILLSTTAIVTVVAACSAQSFATEKGKKQTVRPAQKTVAGNDFQLTLSTVPYSSDPESDYVRIYCAPGDKHAKTSKATK